MSETVTPEAKSEVKPPEAAPAATEDKPLGENGEKALKAERDARASAEKSNAALQKQLDEISAANLSDLERAQKEAKDATELATKAQAEALRFRVAAKHQISDEDAELFLTGSDEETLTKQAARWTERTPANVGPRADLTQGGKGGTGTSTPEDDFASFMQNQLGN